MSVAVVGALNHDVIIRTRHRPSAGETAVGQIAGIACGGKGANQAAAVAEAGAPVRMVGAVGADETGQAQLADLRSRGVDCAAVAVLPDQPTGLAVIALTPDGENSIIVGIGANGALTPETVRTALAREPRPAAVIAQCEVGVDPIEAAAGWCRTNDSRLVLSAGPVLDLAPDSYRIADPLVVNAGEAAALLGTGPATSVDAAVGQLEQLLDQMGCRSAVLTLGPLGALVSGPEGTEHVPAVLVEVLDTTGAGDAFVGALTAALVQGHGLAAAARLGAAAAASAVARIGARSPL